MKKFYFVLFFVSAFQRLVQAQCSVTASNGDYTVSLRLVPSSLIPSSSSCSFGFNYNIEAWYDLKITGPNVPPGLWTSQGTLTCNNGTNGNQTLFLDLNNGATGGTYTTSTSNPYSSLTDCNTATPSSYNCNSFQFEVQGPNLSQNINCNVSALIFPVNLKLFEGQNMDGKNHLFWEATDASSFDFFLVQKSFDAKTFETVSSKIHLNQSNKYNWTEKSEIREKKTYYRLLMNDLGGEVRYSKIISVENYDPNIEFLLYPNPTSSELNAGVDLEKFDPVKVEIIDENGKLMLESSFSKIINTSKISRGKYILKLTDKFNRHLSRSFIIATK